ncbi:STAS domain-containing protein [Kitasatospora sp. NPDC059088]|uniref:STAS domain-containing protein n=1 Tax=Kitasatospora sp. NPDC059088 TaxID=3346722 RepID=UPI0036B1392A
MTGLEVRLHRTAGELSVCALVGDLDIESRAPAGCAIDGLIAERPPLVVIDLERVGFCDSSGLNLLLRARMNAIAAGVDFRLAHPSPAVARVLEITGTDSIFSIDADGESLRTASGR